MARAGQNCKQKSAELKVSQELFQLNGAAGFTSGSIKSALRNIERVRALTTSSAFEIKKLDGELLENGSLIFRSFVDIKEDCLSILSLLERAEKHLDTLNNDISVIRSVIRKKKKK